MAPRASQQRCGEVRFQATPEEPGGLQLDTPPLSPKNSRPASTKSSRTGSQLSQASYRIGHLLRASALCEKDGTWRKSWSLRAFAGQGLAVTLRKTTRTINAPISSEAKAAIMEAFFFDDPSLLRATRLVDVLHNNASILKHCGGTIETFEMSSQVQCIDWFISHNWSVGRWRKFLALVVHFQSYLAIFAVVFVWSVTTALTAGGIMPVLFSQPHWDLDPMGFGAVLLTVPVFFATLCCAHEVGRLFGRSGSNVFLDKTCIHQSDVSKKQQGINKLGAFLRKSEGMVILYSDVYLSKLWTVYEVACFLVVKPEDPIIMLPLFLPKYLAVALVICFVAGILRYLWRSLGEAGKALMTNYLMDYQVESMVSDDVVFVLMDLVLCAVLSPLFKRCVQELKRMRSLVRNFSVKETSCAVEADRPVVYHNIAMFMEAEGLVLEGATQEDALEKFDRLVHEHLGRALEQSMGTVGIPYSYSLVTFMALNSWRMDKIAGGLSPGMDHWRIVPYAVWFVGLVAAAGPLWTASVTACAKRLTYMWSIDWLIALIASLFFGLLYTGLYGFIFWEWVVVAAEEEPVYLGLEVLCVCCFICVAWFVYRPVRLAQQSRTSDILTTNHESIGRRLSGESSLTVRTSPLAVHGREWSNELLTCSDHLDDLKSERTGSTSEGCSFREDTPVERDWRVLDCQGITI